MDIRNYQFFQKLIKLPFIETLWLYGSRARGDNNERSDIDLAITCPKAHASDWLQVRNIIENADTLLKIDCVRYDKLGKNNELKQAIIQQGKCLFMRKEENQHLHKINDSFKKLNNALSQLTVVLSKPMDNDRTIVDASIQRFEFTIELFWKLLKRLIENLGGEVNFPKEVLREAYKANMIDDEKMWLLMLEDRNQTSHTYDADLADKIYRNLHTYLPIMQLTYNNLKIKFKPDE